MFFSRKLILAGCYLLTELVADRCVVNSYVHGIMNGEAIEDVLSGLGRNQEFAIL